MSGTLAGSLRADLNCLVLIPLAVRHSGDSVQFPSLLIIVTTYIILIGISGADLRPPRPYLS
ncbi:hypothetical protein DPO09_22500 [Salmonella enterica]|nr:hypothetical protein [Salmonella enterica]EDQ6177433.1 hypothetical protein [Salmonella enterica subsp. enterica serovar Minnesota]